MITTEECPVFRKITTFLYYYDKVIPGTGMFDDVNLKEETVVKCYCGLGGKPE